MHPMSAPLYPQEIYLLERYTSVEYFGAMRDAWQAMVDHVEDCLARFMVKLPADYRSRPCPCNRTLHGAARAAELPANGPAP